MKMIISKQYGYIPKTFINHKFKYILYDINDEPITALDSLHILSIVSDNCKVATYIEEVKTSEIVYGNSLFLDINTECCVIFKSDIADVKYKNVTVYFGIDEDGIIFGDYPSIIKAAYNYECVEDDIPKTKVDLRKYILTCNIDTFEKLINECYIFMYSDYVTGTTLLDELSKPFIFEDKNIKLDICKYVNERCFTERHESINNNK